MSVEFYGSCPKGKAIPLKELIKYLENEQVVENVYGPFGEEGDPKVLFFPEQGIRGFSVQVTGSDTDIGYSFRQNILPSIRDWQSLLSTLQFLLLVPEFDLSGENNDRLTHDILEQWKSEDVYRQRHLFEAESIIEQLKTETDSFTFPTYPYDLKVYRKDIDFNTSITKQFDQMLKILIEQVSHYNSCYKPSIMVVFSKTGKEHSLIVWTPTIPTLVWEVDWISLSELHFGENKIITFQDFLDFFGGKIKCVGSISAGRKRYELPVLDFKKEQDQQLKTKIISLKSAV